MCGSGNRRTNIRFATALILLLCITKSAGIFKITKVECLALDKSVVNLTLCQLKPVKRDVAALSIRFHLLKPIKSLIMYTDTLRKFNTYQPFLPNMSIDTCAFFKQTKRANYANVLYNLFQEYTNFNHTCPYEGELIVDRFTPTHTNLNIPLFTGDYLTQSSFASKGVNFFSLRVWYTYRELEKWETL